MSTRPDDWDREEAEAFDAMRGELEQLRRRHENDPPLALLRAARARVLPDDLQAAADRYLAANPWARALVAGTEHDDHELTRDDEDRLLARITGAAPAPSSPRLDWRMLWRLALPVAAVIALVVLIGRTRVSDSSPPAGTVAAPPPGVTAPPVSPQPEFVLALEQPELRISPSALAWRGSAGENTLLTDLKPAYDAFARGDYAAAVDAFEALVARYPEAVEVRFYLGVSRLFTDDAAGANAALRDAERLSDAAFAGDVAWYRAIAEERRGDINAARTQLDTLCARANPYQTRACTALAKLKAP